MATIQGHFHEKYYSREGGQERKQVGIFGGIKRKKRSLGEIQKNLEKKGRINKGEGSSSSCVGGDFPLSSLMCFLLPFF